jgi:Rrf2 family transcriptional repressor of oqxAB
MQPYQIYYYRNVCGCNCHGEGKSMIDLRFSTGRQMVLSVALADQDGFRCTSRTLAEGLGTNPSFVRKLLIPLTREGMIVAAIGKGGGLHLGRPSRSHCGTSILQ